MHVTWCTRFESLVWLSLLGLAFATTQTIIERLIFYWGERIADPVELSLCLTR